MFFLVDSESGYSFLWFRNDKSSDMRHLFTTLDGTIEETFKVEDLESLPEDHKFLIFIENPFEKVLYDALVSNAHNFESYLFSIKKGGEQQITTDFLNLNRPKKDFFFFNIHNMDMEEVGKVCNKTIQNNCTTLSKSQKEFLNPDAKLYRQLFKDIDFSNYHFRVHQFYNLKLQTIVETTYSNDFETFLKHMVEFEAPIKVKPKLKRSFLPVIYPNETFVPFFKAKTEMQRINNKVGYCHLYDDLFMSIDEDGKPNISENHKFTTSVNKKNDFIDKNFHYNI